MNKIRKTPAGLDRPTGSSEEFLAIDDDNVRTTQIMAEEDILEFVQSSKNVFNADSDGDNEINDAVPVMIAYFS
ncbi:hypothetical protein TNCV_1093521 [Trichonephila clavipes]|nr:hypothetical protein TNCV_1093521 [Trichonephila clavipes]